MEQDRKALVRRFYEHTMATGDLEDLEERIAEDFTNLTTPEGLPQGRDNIRAVVQMLQEAFSDQRYEIHSLVEDGDEIALSCTWHATHTGDFMGIPATNKSFSARQAHFLRFSGEQLSAHWAVRDDLGMLRQMGILPG